MCILVRPLQTVIDHRDNFVQSYAWKGCVTSVDDAHLCPQWSFLTLINPTFYLWFFYYDNSTFLLTLVDRDWFLSCQFPLPYRIHVGPSKCISDWPQCLHLVLQKAHFEIPFTTFGQFKLTLLDIIVLFLITWNLCIFKYLWSFRHNSIYSGFCLT